METIYEKAREVPVVREVDVLIVGGGPSGLGASIACARTGVKTLLVERSGWLGGMATSGLVHPFMPSYAGDIPINKGIFWEIVERLSDMNAAVHPDKTQMGTGYTGFVKWPHAHVTPFDVEALKWVIQDLVEESGLEVLLHSWAVEVIQKENSVQGVILENKSGRMAVKSRINIDATGDGDIANLCGVPYEKGSTESGLMQPATIFFRLGGVNRKSVDDYIAKHPEEHHFKSFAKAAKDAGEFIPTKEDVLFFYTPRDGEVAVNTTRIHGVDGTDVFDITKAEFETRRQVRVLTKFFKKYVPGFEKSYITTTADTVGFRETRRIIGEYILTKEDILNTKQFEDNVAQCSYMIDIHDLKGPKLFFTPVPEGKSYGIPYRCLLPKKMENLLVTGRCISATHEAQASIRVMPPCFSMGQAAGISAALAIEASVALRDLDIKTLQDKLAVQGQVVNAV